MNLAERIDMQVTKRMIKSLLAEYFTEYSQELDTKCKIDEAQYIVQHLDRYLEIIKLIPFVPKKLNVLDIGVAHGHLAYLISKIFGYRVYGIDTNRTEISFWEKRYQAENISFKICDLTKDRIPFSEQTFDIVLFCEVLEHLPIHPRSILNDIRKILKSTGYLIISTPNLIRIENRLKLLVGRPLSPLDSTFPLNKGEIYGHIYEYTTKQLVEILKTHGFSIDKVLLRDFGPHHPKIRIFSFLLTKIFKYTRDTILIRATLSSNEKMKILK